MSRYIKVNDSDEACSVPCHHNITDTTPLIADHNLYSERQSGSEEPVESLHFKRNTSNDANVTHLHNEDDESVAHYLVWHLRAKDDESLLHVKESSLDDDDLRSPNQLHDQQVDSFEEIGSPEIGAPCEVSVEELDVVTYPPSKETNPFAENYNDESDEEIGPCIVSAPEQSSNPFADDCDEKSFTPAHSVVLNPFDEGYDESALPPVPSFNGGSTNPFDDDYSPRPISSGKADPGMLRRSHSARPIVAPSRITMDGRRASSATVRASSGRVGLQRPMPDSPEYRNTVKLLELGFTPQTAYEAVRQHREFDEALASLRQELITDLDSKNVVKSSVWVPLIAPRIGSWMPSSANSNNVILYYITVKARNADMSYTIMKRYSEFVELNSKLTPYIRKSSNLGLRANFVDDRFSSMIFGCTEDTYNQRKEMLHRWLAYVCMDPGICTHQKAMGLLKDFLCWDSSVEMIVTYTGKEKAPLNLMLKSID